MAITTEISWCDSTLNPWIGCTKVGPGCDNCYAAAQDKFRHWTPAGWGTGQPRKRTSAANWKLPLKWNDTPFYECAECSQPDCNWRGEGDGQACGACGGHVVAARRRVFCASLADVFDNEVPQEWRDDLWALIEATPNLDWLLLTKRIGNVMGMIPEAWATKRLPKQVLLGATMVNQPERDRDMVKLINVPAYRHFISMEPLLGAVDMDFPCGHDGKALIDWVIVGGESGPGARPMHPDWARSLRDQCATAGVPFHFKQWGEFSTVEMSAREYMAPLPRHEGELLASPGGALGGAPYADTVTVMRRMGKKAAGRLLDGVTHDAFPEVHHG